MPRLVVYSDYVCPFCYLATPVLAWLREQDGIEVEARPFELRPEPAPLPDPRAPELIAAWEGTVLPLAAAAGLEMRLPALRARTRKAHEAAAFARERQRFQPMHDALFRAVFVEGRDIGRIDVLVEIGVAAGLDPTELALALGLDSYADAVAQDERAASAAGIDAVPAFVAEGELALGLLPYPALRDWLRGVRERSEP
jgi:predicted DsbA family dithiol-disulfide isomerase